MLQSDSGDLRGAFQSIATGARIGRQLGQEPILLAMLVQISIKAILNDIFLSIVKAHANNPEALHLAQGMEKAFGETLNFKRSLGGEMIIGRTEIQALKKGQFEKGDPFSSLLLKTNGAPRAVICDAWDASLIGYYRGMFDRLKQSHGDPMQEYEAVKQAEDAEEAVKSHPGHELNAQLGHDFSSTALRLSSDEARQRLREATVALLEYRNRTKRFPSNLSELGPPVPLDPFDKQPLRYHKTANGFTLYSIGENLKDDGGKDSGYDAANKRTYHPDIVVSYP